MTTRMDDAPVDDFVPVRPRRLHRRRALAISAALTILGALGGVAVLNTVAQRVQIVAVARTVPVGSQINADDLVAAQVPADSGLTALPWAELDQIVGQTAAVTLMPGQIVVPGSAGASPLPGPGQAIVGIAVEIGQAPASVLTAQDRIGVIDTETSTSTGITAEVVRDLGADGRRTVDVLVDAADAAAIARLARTGHAAIVLLEDR
ncbi:SAF domain-containing protein [Pseudonocardia lutea]|uniref:SAF domain-containing protein n=1 Tax=Pseudonocardia lutea TaxID=2172015 RepID=A0ABW1IG75_9PSEU